MKKIIKLLLSLTNIVISSSSNALITIACTSESNVLTQSNYVSMYQNYFSDFPYINVANPYYSFINKYINKSEESASNNSKQKFDDLQKNPIWSTYSQLSKDLTQTKLSKDKDVTIDVNWNTLYTQANLDTQSITKIDNLQLSFYNTIASVYQKTNILRLLQKVSFKVSPSEEDNVVAYNSYYPGIYAQTQTYGKDFVNQTLINQQYKSNFWNSNHLNGVSIHEYGHALSNYISVPVSERNLFNTIKINTIKKQNITLKRPSAYNDITQVLMDYLDTKITINATSTTDEEIKKFLFPLIVVKSRYSNISFRTGDVNQRNEFLAEAFSLWLGTDNDKRTWRWELLNDFFMNYLPTYGNLTT